MKLNKFSIASVGLRSRAAVLRGKAGALPYLATALIAGFSFVPSAFSQVTPTTIIVLSNMPPTLFGGAGQNSTTNFFRLNAGQIPSNNIIPLRQGTGFASSSTVTGNLSSVTTLGYSINWAVSIDGTNWQTASLLQLTNLPNGMATNCFTTNFPGALVNNFAYITPASMEWCALAGTNLSISNVIVSFGNVVPGGYP